VTGQRASADACGSQAKTDYQAAIDEFERHIRAGTPFDDLEDADDIRARLAMLSDA